VVGDVLPVVLTKNRQELKEGNRMAAEMIDNESGEIISNIDNGNALAALNKSEIDQQIATAHRFPRSVSQFQKDAMQLATLDEETAESMFYAMPRGGKTIEGPSVRLAEVVASSWGNLRSGARIIGIDEKFVTAQGFCFDLEKNVANSVEVKRRITNKKGDRFNDDMITVTSNAACSIALREAIFKVVPRALFKSIYQAARETAIGNAQTLASRRANVMDYFGKMGATPDRVLAAIERAAIEDITLDDLAKLKGIATSIKEGDLSVDNAFPDPKLKGASEKTQSLNDELKKPTASSPKSDESESAKRAKEPVKEEAAPQGGGECGNYDDFMKLAEAAAKEKNVDVEQFDKGIGLALMAARCKGKQNKTTIPWRESVLSAVRSGSFDFSTGKIGSLA
jgi:hypothetical protein